MGVRIWLPLMASRRQWSDRIRVVELPVFPSYFFAQVSVDAWMQLLRARGVLTVVKAGARPAWIRDECIRELQRTLDIVRFTPEPVEIETEFVSGDVVRVVDGPFARLTGTIREVRGGGRRLLVGIEQIGRAVSVSLGAASIELMPPTRNASHTARLEYGG